MAELLRVSVYETVNDLLAHEVLATIDPTHPRSAARSAVMVAHSNLPARRNGLAAVEVRHL